MTERGIEAPEMKIAWRLIPAVGTGAMIAATAAASPAVSAEDTTPPTLTTPVKASFVVGQQLEIGRADPCGLGEPHDLWLRASITFAWQGADASGSVLYDLWGQNQGGEYVIFENSTLTSYTGLGPAGATTAHNDCGGGNPSITWQVFAKDAAGNTTSSFVRGGGMRLNQDNKSADMPTTRPSPPSPTRATGPRPRAGAGPTVESTRRPPGTPR